MEASCAASWEWSESLFTWTVLRKNLWRARHRGQRHLLPDIRRARPRLCMHRVKHVSIWSERSLRFLEITWFFHIEECYSDKLFYLLENSKCVSIKHKRIGVETERMKGMNTWLRKREMYKVTEGQWISKQVNKNGLWIQKTSTTYKNVKPVWRDEDWSFPPINPWIRFKSSNIQRGPRPGVTGHFSEQMARYPLPLNTNYQQVCHSSKWWHWRRIFWVCTVELKRNGNIGRMSRHCGKLVVVISPIINLKTYMQT